MRIGKRGFTARIKGDLQIEFGKDKLTSFAGLELVRRLLRSLNFWVELRRSQRRLRVGGDFCFSKTVLTVVGMLLVGAKRLHHVAFLRDDPIFLRFAGLSRAPTERTLGRSLRRLSFRTWPELDRLSTLVARAGLDKIDAKRWTMDIDGTVLSTGLQVERAQRGFNPHHRKNPSYYPLIATLAQTGHVIGHMNRRGNIQDCYRSAEFLRATMRTARDELQLRGIFELRADSAFFRRDFLETCDRVQLEYAIKVPMWPCFNLRGIVKKKRKTDWQWVDRARGIQGLFAEMPFESWKRVERVAVYRKRINHRSSKSHQLDLFNPDDGEWEYSVIATNKALGLRALWDFQAGRGAQEKTIGELKSGYAFAAVPTQTYCSNTAWQKLNILTHNLMTSFQLIATAPKRPRTSKRTALYVLRSIATLRFEWITKAARMLRPHGKPLLRLAQNEAVEKAYREIEHAIAKAA